MEFNKLDKLASKYMDNKRHFEKSFKLDGRKEFDEDNKSKPDMASHRQELSKIRSKVGNLKSSTGNQICLFFNTTKGCVVKNCKFEQFCCYVKVSCAAPNIK